MDRSAIRTDRAPQAIGPYSQALACGDLVFLSGQIGLDPATGNLVPGGTAAEAEQVLKNLQAMLFLLALRNSQTQFLTLI